MGKKRAKPEQPSFILGQNRAVLGSKVNLSKAGRFGVRLWGLGRTGLNFRDFRNGLGAFQGGKCPLSFPLGV